MTVGTYGTKENEYKDLHTNHAAYASVIRMAEEGRVQSQTRQDKTSVKTATGEGQEGSLAWRSLENEGRSGLVGTSPCETSVVPVGGGFALRCSIRAFFVCNASLKSEK